jgi:hypothetical protein
LKLGGTHQTLVAELNSKTSHKDIPQAHSSLEYL